MGDTDEWKNFRKWESTIPWIKFPHHWEVKVLPNFGGATARFAVRNGDERISVYLDCDCVLGAMDKPYWEVYPVQYNEYSDGCRFFVGEEADLLKCIQSQLDGEVWRDDS